MIDRHSTIKLGMIVYYKGKQYIIVHWDIIEAGNVMEIGIVKTGQSRFKLVRYFYNEEIEQLWEGIQ